MPPLSEKSRLEILGRIVEDAVDPILVEDLDGNVTEANREALRLLGVSRQSLVGSPVDTTVPAEHRAEARSLVARCLAGEDIRNVETFRVDAEGRTIPVLVTLSLLKDDQGVPRAVATFAKDISVLRATRERLEEMNQKLESLVAQRTEKLASALNALTEANERLAQELRIGAERASEKERENRAVFLGASIPARALRDSVEKHSQTDETLLMTGPRGAGEAAVAQAIHYGSSRRDRPFVYIDCTRFNADQEESLFGSDEWENPEGRIYLAHKGTLYMAQVDQLPRGAQWALRSYLETARQCRASGEPPMPDLRLIVYSRRDLFALASQGMFDAALAAELSATRLVLPSLAERREDIIEMADALRSVSARSFGKVVKGIDEAARKRLLAYNWPGNIDELDAVIKQSVIVTVNATIEDGDVQLLGGQRLGDYNLLRKLGEGGMGEVWLARHTILNRPAAVKLIRTDIYQQKEVDEDEVMARFEREAKVTALLRSPHTVQLYDFGTAPDGGLYYVMEYLDGRDLDAIVTEFGPLSPARVLHFLEQTAYSLAEAHDAGLIHRDIKPSNIFSCRLGPYRDFTKLIDFGIVRRYSDNATRITKAHLFPGTPAFAAPEMVTNPDRMGPASDLYSLGCTAFFLLTGQPPFQGETDWAVMMHHTNTPAPALTSVNKHLPAWTDELVARLMAKRPEDRPASALDVVDSLVALSQETPWREADAARWWDERTG